jgi:hypothetical protein
VKSKAKIGDLIYVPSEVILFKNDKAKEGTVEEWKKVEKPTSLLITNIRSGTYEVYYESEYWLVNKKQVYKNQD